ncbi:hypothetical protein [Sphingomonas sp. ID0503]|uniref:hypothetical protein n=1 Tax=Sphingomonas sp. ID0503 TaxID=3399691 RepID=UPI003AFB186E
MEGLWSLMTIVGPIVLAAALIWAILRNRKTSAARSEQGARDLYARENRDERRREAESQSAPD